MNADHTHYLYYMYPQALPGNLQNKGIYYLNPPKIWGSLTNPPPHFISGPCSSLTLFQRAVYLFIYGTGVEPIPLLLRPALDDDDDDDDDCGAIGGILGH
jgi:hypothetical protein